MTQPFDVIIVGGGPAGLSAALMLGRCRRSVLVLDSGRYRNAASDAMHGYLTRDGLPPAELRRVARQELDRYGVRIECATAKNARKDGDSFVVELAEGGECRCRKLVLATGVVDKVPKLENMDQFYGKSVHHCPYCDAWEHREQPMAVYGKGRKGMGLAMSMKTWTDRVFLCTDGPSGLSGDDRRQLDALEIVVRTEHIARLEGEGPELHRVVFTRGAPIDVRAIFFNTGQHQHCELAGQFSCRFTERGAIHTDRWERTNVPGLYAVGDCSRNVQWVVVAAAQGAIAAEKINIELQEEDRAAFLAAKRRSGGYPGA